MLLIAIGSGHRRTMLLIAIGSGHRRTKLMIAIGSGSRYESHGQLNTYVDTGGLSY